MMFLRLLVSRIIIHPIYLRASLRSRPRYTAYVYRKNKSLRNIWNQYKESARLTSKQFACDIALLKDGFILFFFSYTKILIIKVKFEKILYENESVLIQN